MTSLRTATLCSLLVLAACSAEEAEDADASGDAFTQSDDEKQLKARPFRETELAKTSGCLACHKVDGKLVGPSFHEIAQRYRPNHPEADAPQTLVDRLAKSIVSGSKGNWTFLPSIPMPPNSSVSEENAKTLARAILESGPGSCTKTTCE